MKHYILLVSMLSAFVFNVAHGVTCIGHNYEQPIPTGGIMLPAAEIGIITNTIKEGEQLSLVGGGITDPAGNAFFYWCAEHGALIPEAGSPAFDRIRYIAPSVSENLPIKIWLKIGDGLGYIDIETAIITVQDDPAAFMMPDKNSGELSIILEGVLGQNDIQIFVNNQPITPIGSGNTVSLNLYQTLGTTFQDFDQPAQIHVLDANGQEIYSGCFPFKDVCPGRWYTRPVMKLWKEGVVEGYADGTSGIFGPQNPALRAELIAATARALGADETPPATPPFDDVSVDDWYAGYVAYAKENGLIQGCDPANNLFCPADPVSRAAAAKVIALAFLAEQADAFANGESPAWLFTDVQNPDDWFYPYVYALQEAQAAHGYPDGSYGVGNDLTRAEMAKLICIAKFGAMECSEMGDPDAPQVFSVVPQEAVLNQLTTFTVTGMNLPETLAFWIHQCETVEDLGGDTEQRQFSCTPSHAAGVKDGLVKDTSGGIELLNFQVTVTEEIVTPPPGEEIVVTDISPLTVTLNESTVFTITGQNLPDTLAFWIHECEGMAMLPGGTATQRSFECTPSYATGPHSAEVKDISGGTLLKTETIEFVEEGTVIEPPPPSACSPFSVSSVTPENVPLDEPAVFTVTGSCLPEGTAFWLDECENGGSSPDELSGGTETERRFACTPNHKGGLHSGKVKEYSGASASYDFSVNYIWGTPNVVEVSPLTATIGEVTDFRVYGTNLKPETVLWINGCDGSNASIGGTSLYRDFQCTPTFGIGEMQAIVKDAPGGDELLNFTVTFQ